MLLCMTTVRYLPHKAAHRISELNLFLYLRISGVSLCGLVFVGFTLTTEPFRVGSCLMASGLSPSQENPTETQYSEDLSSVHRHHCLIPSAAPDKYPYTTADAFSKKRHSRKHGHGKHEHGKETDHDLTAMPAMRVMALLAEDCASSNHAMLGPRGKPHGEQALSDSCFPQRCCTYPQK